MTNSRETTAMQEPSTTRRCIACRHFRNSPEYIEHVFKGMTAMGSGHSSVRKDDGICEVTDEYLSAHDWCDKFEEG
jgi:hypothetical protein